MVMNQRGFSGTPANGAYTLDRYNVLMPVSSKFTVSQSSTAPTGFINSLLVTSSSAYSVGSTEAFGIQQVIEGYNIADLAWGTSFAKTVTLSFWVYSSLTGTFGGVLQNYASDRSYPFSYTISAANTWTQISITIPGDTTGTWTTTNSGGIALIFSMGTGSSKSGTAGVWGSTYYASVTGATSVVGTSGATWYATGIQLEAGSTATSYDYRHASVELQMCQRYFTKSFAISVAPQNDYDPSIKTTCAAYGAGDAWGTFMSFPVTMRTIPTVTLWKPNGIGSNGKWAVYASGVWTTPTSTTAYGILENGFIVYPFSTGLFSTAGAYIMTGNYSATAEL
jgi:hypothetical protein